MKAEDFKNLSAKVSELIKSRIQSSCKGAILDTFMCTRKILNEVVMLVTAEGEKNPLLDLTAVHAFIVLVRLDGFMQHNVPVSSTVRVHRLMAEVD